MIKSKKLLSLGILLACSSSFLMSCSNKGSSENYIKVHFDPNTSISVYTIEDKELSEPKKIIPPTVTIKDPSTNPDNLAVLGWYTEASCQNKWDFKTMKVEKDMTLYAKKYCWKAKIIKGKKEEYIKRHNNIWKEMVDVLKSAGISNYSIWINGDEVFGYYECEKGIEYACKIQSESSVVKRWNEYMKDVMIMDIDPVTKAQPHLEQVFNLD